MGGRIRWGNAGVAWPGFNRWAPRVPVRSCAAMPWPSNAVCATYMQAQSQVPDLQQSGAGCFDFSGGVAATALSCAMGIAMPLSWWQGATAGPACDTPGCDVGAACATACSMCMDVAAPADIAPLKAKDRLSRIRSRMDQDDMRLLYSREWRHG